MKKTMIILGAIIALVACSKEKPVTKNDGPIDPSKVVFNFTVKHADDTKAIKTDWADGDIVYVFFADNSSQWVKLTRSGSSWTFTDKDGGYDYTGLVLASSGNVTAVYANAATPSIDGGITFANAQPGYLLTATATYSVTATDNVTTLSATLDMRAPANLIQVYVPGLSAPGSGNEYVLNMTNVKPFTVGEIIPGDAVSITYGTANFPLMGVNATFGSDSGYYFWGVLNETDASARTYNFQVVEQNAEKKYAISSKSKTGKATLSGSKAIKLTSLTDNGNFVSLGYAGGPLWATGNVSGDSAGTGTIVAPTEYGDYYSWNRLDEVADSYDYSDMGSDTATQLRSDWRMPTKAEFIALCGASGEKAQWVDSPVGIKVTGDNGLVVFFPAAGNHQYGPGDFGYYWSSNLIEFDDQLAYYLFFSIYFVAPDNYDLDSYRNNGFSVRPVRNQIIFSVDNYDTWSNKDINDIY